jgi:Pyridoxamine 5'-phosphate oxidase
VDEAVAEFGGELNLCRFASAAPRLIEGMALSPEEREEFLAEPHIAALSVYAGDTRGPLTVPIWYQYSPGGEPWILTGPGSRKARLIEATGYFSLMVERLEPTTRYVSVDGAVSRIEPGTDALLEEITRRYLSGNAADKYLEFARNELGEHVVIYMQPQHWLSADMGAF